MKALRKAPQLPRQGIRTAVHLASVRNQLVGELLAFVWFGGMLLVLRTMQHWTLTHGGGVRVSQRGAKATTRRSKHYNLYAPFWRRGNS